MAANGSKTQPLQISNKNANVPEKPLVKTIEETYQKRSHHHHNLLRPDTYISFNVKNTQNLWVYEGDKMVNRNVTYVPGLYKIFDEILVNAADNKQRDPSMNLLEVENNFISVYNNGEGISVARHKVEKVYVPEMIFGQLLTSSNYDDETKKTTVCSTIETSWKFYMFACRKVFSNNMNKTSPPTITDCNNAESWTRISFKPDLAKFQMDRLEADVVALMKKWVIDLAGCLGESVEVVLNGKKVPVKSFSDYVNLYLESRFGDKKDSIPREGLVDYVTDQLVDYVEDKVYQANPNVNVKPHLVKNNFWVFVNALIDNPAFNSQTKLTLATQPCQFRIQLHTAR
ncbi:hypothetical protein Pfo_028328 [Paulownia fortunei]|nr:hypothetical protein Pfo_028328 [Paulownia fortunei]